MKYFSLTTRIAVLAAALIFWLSPAALHAAAGLQQCPIAARRKGVRAVERARFTELNRVKNLPVHLGLLDGNLDVVEGVMTMCKFFHDGSFLNARWLRQALVRQPGSHAGCVISDARSRW